MSTPLPLPLYTRGKVRDVYVAGDDLLIVATDRISAFDHVLPTPIPDKGRVLTQLSAFWFAQTRAIVRNHLLAVDPAELLARVPALRQVQRETFAGRAMLVQRCERIDIECVVRGYLSGSAMEEYRRTGMVAGIRLPAGLRNGDRLPEPLFTPATKASTGHDENITFVRMADLVGEATAARLREVSVALYRHASTRAQPAGLLLADTKFEFGRHDGQIVLIDEALTPDSSRYWDTKGVSAGEPQSLDKEYIREYLKGLDWDRNPPAPPLPAPVIDEAYRRYRIVHDRLGVGGPVPDLRDPGGAT